MTGYKENQLIHIEPIKAFQDNYIWLIHNDKNSIVVDPGDANPVIQTLERKKSHKKFIKNILFQIDIYIYMRVTHQIKTKEFSVQILQQHHLKYNNKASGIIAFSTKVWK